MLTDVEIAAMAPGERRALIERLSAPLDDLPQSAQSLTRRRRGRLALVSACAVLLVPWIVYLGISLPGHYEARHWDIAWVGFDTLLLTLFAATAVLGWLRRQLAVLTAFATGVVLLVDAWFDVTTAGVSDRPWSIASAVFVEVPLALLLINASFRLLKMMAVQMWALPSDHHVWEAPMPRMRGGVARRDHRSASVTTATTTVGSPPATARESRPA